ncbi:uncharacterized protein LOC127709409 [Mytilus californianus]|uniref:uncharacterized protein LOC127709409 n=1 Tax=Mytilus californianus TaxID=6549 RepID=UPI0022460F52|nr:uncharacterized protein LOC127709409 [Mytilus californianus]
MGIVVMKCFLVVLGISRLNILEVQACENISCFMWRKTGIQISMSCYIKNVYSSILILDPYNTTQANCSAFNNTFVCDALPEIGAYFNSLKNETVLQWDISHELTTGKWLCIHGVDIIELYINPTKGSHLSIKIGMKTEIQIKNDTYLFTFECSSCLTPYGNSVEFILNNNILDVLRENNRKCYHKSGECNYKTCVCCKDSNRYVLKYELPTKTQISSSGCRMRFNDENQQGLVVKEVLLQFNDLERHNLSLLISRGNGTYIGFKESEIISTIKKSTKETTEKIETAPPNKSFSNLYFDFERSHISPKGHKELSYTHDFRDIFTRLAVGFAIVIFIVALACCCVT